MAKPILFGGRAGWLTVLAQRRCGPATGAAPITQLLELLIEPPVRQRVPRGSLA
jgi:hypothetical protein